LQSLQPDSAIRRQAAREARELPPMRIGRAEMLWCESSSIGGAEHACADRIGPQDPRAVARPQPRGQGAGGMHRQSRIAKRLQLEFRMIHSRRHDRMGWACCPNGFSNRLPKRRSPWGIVSIASAERQVHGRSPAGGIQSPDNLNPGRTLSRTLALNSWG